MEARQKLSERGGKMPGAREPKGEAGRHFHDVSELDFSSRSGFEKILAELVAGAGVEPATPAYGADWETVPCPPAQYNTL